MGFGIRVAYLSHKILLPFNGCQGVMGLLLYGSQPATRS
jgi:hypothetical protein